MRFRPSLVLGFLTLLLSGCVTLAYDLKIRRFGFQDKQLNQQFVERARRLPWDKTYEVDVLNDFPEGICERGDEIYVSPEYKSRYIILGDIESSHWDRTDALKKHFLIYYWYFDIHPQHGKGHDVYCKIQAPLRTLTFGIWAGTPFNYPCLPKIPSNPVELQTQEIARAVTAMGGNLAIIGKTGDTTIYTYSHSYSYAPSSVYVHKASHVYALAFNDKHPQEPRTPLRKPDAWVSSPPICANEKSKSIWQKAAKGDIDALLTVGQFYLNGRHVSQDDKEATRIFRLAADQDSTEGIFFLGYMYLEGRGVSQDYQEALRLTRMAASRGHSGALLNMGYIFEKGKGIPQNYQKAFQFYQAAADKGNKDGLYNLGRMHENGRGVPKNINKALIHYRKAAKRGHKEAEKAFNRL